jgi:sulfate transport system permease protein
MAPEGAILIRGLAMSYISLMVLLPMTALVWQSVQGGWSTFWESINGLGVLSALELTVGVSTVVVLINALFGTLIAWVLVRDSFPGKSLVNSIIDLPFALPTIVAGVTLLALYGPYSPIHVDVSGTRIAIGLALLFVTLPFVTRAVQPVLISMDRDMEEAAAVLGASRLLTFRKIILPNLGPAVLSGAGLAFARALGEFGSVTIVASNIPNKTQVLSLVIFGDIQNGETIPAADLSIVLLGLSLSVLLTFTFLSRAIGEPHDL